MGFLISLIVAALWLALAIIALGVLWGLLVRLPFRIVGASGNLVRTLMPDWLFLCGLTVLSALVCAIWSPAWGMVMLGVGAVIMWRAEPRH